MNTYSFVEGNEPNDSDYAPVEFKEKKLNVVNKKQKQRKKKQCYSPIMKIVLIAIIGLLLIDMFLPKETVTTNTNNLLRLSSLPEFASYFKN